MDVMYTVPQLAKKLNLNPRYIRRALIEKRGAPHIKDEKGHIYINGKELYEWGCNYIEKQKTKKNTIGKMKDGEFYCVKCRCRVVGVNVYRDEDSKNRFLKGICPVCGTKLNRYLGDKDN